MKSRSLLHISVKLHIVIHLHIVILCYAVCCFCKLSSNKIFAVFVSHFNLYGVRAESLYLSCCAELVYSEYLASNQ